ncbi:DEAD/DEAH box helicase family protein [Microbacterium timonense]|uniref:hypothetical protein n=1 Tax=Microbacterium timonense TaxID=2086576 RepID=UPI000D0F638E|nr:hypothetical protein [Microbacterium timonense]
MLFSLTGASGSGKSSVLPYLAEVDWGADVECVEFDSIGVPDGADTAWRHDAIEFWLQRGREVQERGGHLVLCGQVAMGELLAAPSADRLERIAVCLLHCSPSARTARLLRRGEDPASIVHHVRFGEWLRAHTRDPAHAPEVIQVPSKVPMQWSRWTDLPPGDPAWRAEVIDNDSLTPAETALVVERWIRRELG